MDGPVLIPEPKRYVFSGYDRLERSDELKIAVERQCSRMTLQAAERLESWVRNHWNGRVSRTADGSDKQIDDSVFVLVIQERQDDGESYELRTDCRAAHLSGGPRGILHAVQTWIQLAQVKTTTEVLAVPLAEIEDNPDFPVRGLFAECYWGPDLMQLSDWRELIDEMAAFKLNTLTIGLHGCWHASYSEQTDSPPYFLFAPVLDHPESMPRSRIRYYDPDTGTMETASYMPVIYEQDLLGRIIAYAVGLGIRVVPLFNGPGHSLLLPKLYPEISAVDKKSQPTGKGYSLTAPNAFGMLKTMHERIIDRYLRPYGQTWFHIGMDEISGWCESDLKRYTPRELLCLYLTEIGTHLLERGIDKIIIWHDCADRLCQFDEAFERLLERQGMAGKVVIHWWRYVEPDIELRPVKGTEAWVAPSTGYTSSWLYRDYLDNIDMMVDAGSRSPIDGVVAYTVYSPAQRRNTAYLAEKSWNKQAGADLFEQRYARGLASGSERERQEGVSIMRRIFGDTPDSMLLTAIPELFRGRLNGKGDFDRTLDGIAANAGIRRAYERIAVYLRKAERCFEQAEDVPGEEYEIRMNRFYCHQAEVVIESLLQFIRNARQLEDIGRSGARTGRPLLEELQRQASANLERLDKLLSEMKATLPRYFVPDGLRTYTPMREALRDQTETIGMLLKEWIEQNGPGEAERE